MTRATRGARSRRGTLLTLVAMTAVVTAGVVTVLGFGDVLREWSSGTGGADEDQAITISRWLSLPLLVIGAVAVPAVGHELSIARREEVGLARLRGVHGLRMVVLLLAEPLLAVVVGALAGLALGLAGTWLTTRWWLEEPGVGASAYSLGAAALVVVVAMGAVSAGMLAASREPLSDQVSIATRTRPATAWSLFGSVLVLAAAGLAVYRSGRQAEPDLLVLAGPALVGLAAGQLTVWLLRGVARLAQARTTGSTLPAFLATRRVGRGADRGTSLRLLVAAGAVATLAATGAAGVSGWTDDNARLTSGAPYRVDFDLTAQEASATAAELDPQSRWLAAAVLVPDDSPTRRRAFVDTARYEELVGDFYAGTPAADVTDDLAGLRTEARPPAVGDRLTVAADAFPTRVAETGPQAIGAVEITLDYVTAAGSPGTAIVRLLGADEGQVSGSTELEECQQGCVAKDLAVATGVEFQGDFFTLGDDFLTNDDGRRTTILRSLRLGDTELVDDDWTVTGAENLSDEEKGIVERTDDGALRVTTNLAGGVRALPESLVRPAPVLATEQLAFGEGGPVVSGPGGDQSPAEIAAELPGLPLVGGAGLLGDLPAALYGSGPTVPAAQVMVLAAADTPDNVLAQLRQAGGTVRTLEEIESATRLETGAVTAWAYAVMAGCCLAVALLAMAASSARQRAAYRIDVASLRVVGVPTRQIRSAGIGELVLLATVAVVAGTAAGLLAARLLLDALPLAQVPEFSVPLEAASPILPAVGIGLLLALLVAVVAGRGRRLDLDDTRPAILRDEQAVELAAPAVAR